MNHSVAELGGGVFTASDAARILKISPRKARYWFSYYLRQKHFQSEFRYYFTFKNTLAVNFLTLMEMYVFYSLKEKKIPVHRIIQTHQFLSNFLSTPYPFADKAIYTDGSNLLIAHHNNFFSTDGKDQYKLKLELDKFFQKVSFSADGKVTSYHPLGLDSAVVVDPNHQFGNPTIKGTNIKVKTIFDLYNAGEKKKTIAELYHISIKQINDVIKFSDAA
jgi:uncharacterized protein (DUF433 family)